MPKPCEAGKRGTSKVLWLAWLVGSRWMLRHSCLDGVGRRIHTYLYAAWMPDEAVWQIGGDFITVMDMEKYIRAPNKYPRRGTQSIQSMDTGQ